MIKLTELMINLTCVYPIWIALQITREEQPSFCDLIELDVSVTEPVEAISMIL